MSVLRTLEENYECGQMDGRMDEDELTHVT